MGWGRCSCAGCIFGSPDQWASLRAAAQEQFDRIAAYEKEFGVTIQRKLSVTQQADKGTPYAGITPERVTLANSTTYPHEIIMPDWQLPAGAYGESAGPT